MAQLADWWIFDVGGMRTIGAIAVHGVAGFVGFASAAYLWERVKQARATRKQ